MVPSCPLARARPPRCTARGFSLAESLLAVALVAVLVGLAVPSFGHVVARQRLKSVAGELAAQIGQARLEAARRGSPVYLAMRDGSDWCWSLATTPGSDCADGASPATLWRVDAGQFPGVGLMQASSRFVRFDATPSGALPLSQAAGAEFLSAQGQRLRVYLTPLGRAAICSPDGDAGDSPCR